LAKKRENIIMKYKKDIYNFTLIFDNYIESNCIQNIDNYKYDYESKVKYNNFKYDYESKVKYKVNKYSNEYITFFYQNSDYIDNEDCKQKLMNYIKHII